MENLELDLKHTLEYLKMKRDEELIRFNSLFLSRFEEENIVNCFNSLLRKQKQFRTCQDAILIYDLTK